MEQLNLCRNNAYLAYVGIHIYYPTLDLFFDDKKGGLNWETFLCLFGSRYFKNNGQCPVVQGGELNRWTQFSEEKLRFFSQ